MTRTTLDHDARAAMLRAAGAEAARRGRKRIGTEDLLLGLLAEPGGAAQIAIGCDIAQARAASARLDAQALGSFGITAESGPDVTSPPLRTRHAFTAGARSALVRAVGLARQRKESRITAADLTYGVLTASRPDDALAVLDALGVDIEAATQASLQR